MTSKEAYDYLLGLLELEDDIRWPLVKESMDKFKELVDQQDILEEYNVTHEILREVLLTGQMFRNHPTLSECIKEWEDDGFKFDKIFCYELINKKNNIRIYFDNESTGIWCNIEGRVTLKQLIRLIKTFRALGWNIEYDK